MVINLLKVIRSGGYLQCAEGKFPHFLIVNNCNTFEDFLMKFGGNKHLSSRILIVKSYCLVFRRSTFMRQNLKFD